MSGTKPTNATLAQHIMSAADGSHIIVREFRGAQLVLVAYDGRGGFTWRNVMLTDEKHKPLRMPHAFALRLADKASREYGAKCATLAHDGTLTQPAHAINAEFERQVERCISAAAKTFGTVSERMNQLSKVFPDVPPRVLAKALFHVGGISRTAFLLIEANGFAFAK